MAPEALVEVARAVMEAAQFCFLITQEAGESRARLMQPFAPEPDLTVWLGTSPSTRKAQTIAQHPAVTLAFAHPQDGAYVTLSGAASLERDAEQRQRYWRESFAAFWPVGPMGEDYALIKVVPTRIELMHIAQAVAPEPFGLRPAILTRTEAGWASIDQ